MKNLTTREILASLRRSMGYSDEMEQKLKEMEADACAIEEEEKPVLEALAEVGVVASGIDASLGEYLPLSAEAVEVLLKFLPKMADPRVQDMMVRYIGTTKARYDGTPLADLFDSGDNMHFKWAIADAISRSRPMNLENWIAKTLVDRRHGQAREMLCAAAARLLPREQANALLLQCFDDMPGHAAGALRVTGGEKELAFLRKRLPGPKGWVGKALARAVVGIEKRLNKPGK